jgi:hypothetical protein
VKIWGKDGMQPAGDGFTHLVIVDTPYHPSRPVPASAHPPAGVLRAGTRVRILEQTGDHARVESEGGVVGHVASGALACDATLRA